VLLFLAVTFAAEKVFHAAERYLSTRKDLFGIAKGLQAVKHEFFLLGFVSMMLIALTDQISSICTKSSTKAQQWTPCSAERLGIPSRLNEDHECPVGMEPFIDLQGLYDVHYLVFVLGLVQVFVTFLVMFLGVLTVQSSKWREWEEKAQADMPTPGSKLNKRFTIQLTTHGASGGLSAAVSALAPVTFLMAVASHMMNCVNERRYKVFRGIFITNNMNSTLYSKFDFRKFLNLAQQQDFSDFMSLSIPMWSMLMIYVYLFGIQGSYMSYWFTCIGLILSFTIGGKMCMVCNALSKTKLIWDGTRPDGEHSFKLENYTHVGDLFWFRSPFLLQACLKFVIFHSSLLLADVSFFWVQTNKDDLSCWKSVMGDNSGVALLKVGVAVLQLLHCGIILTPIYALVVRMGKLNEAEKGHMLQSMENAEEIEHITKTWALKMKKIKSRAKKNSLTSTPSSSPTSAQPSTPAAGKEPGVSAAGEATPPTLLEKQRSPKVAAEEAAGSGPAAGAGSGDLLVEDLADVPDQEWRGGAGENGGQGGEQA